MGDVSVTERIKAMQCLMKQVEKYMPINEQEEKDKKLILNWLYSEKDVLTRNNEEAHLTASAWIVSPDRKQVLMIYHNLYSSWAWLGGHADGNANLLQVAIKEVKEESGLTNICVLSNDIFSIEILSVNGHEKRGQYVSSHLHLNITFLFEANPEDLLQIKPDENSGVQWIAIKDISHMSNEPWYVNRIYAKLCDKVEDQC